MNLERILGTEEVGLEAMLHERDARAACEQRLTGQMQEDEGLVVLTMNMAGPVKSFPLLLASYAEGRRLAEARFEKLKMIWTLMEERKTTCGPAAFYRVKGDLKTVKAAMCEIEDENAFCRLFDIDVIDPSGRKLSRIDLNQAPRRCLICGQPAAVCGRSRRHSVKELQEESVRRMLTYFREVYAEHIAVCAYQAMVDEVSLKPKPGLVDREDNGSHQDMNYESFIRSADAIAPYFGDCARLGYDGFEQADEVLFRKAQAAGLQAEETMYQATGGVNTHKGLIYSFGLLAAAAGALRAEMLIDGRRSAPGEADIRKKAAGLAVCSLQDLKSDMGSHGLEVYRKYQAQGVRLEAARGFPSVSAYVLPHLKERGRSELQAKFALLELLAHVEDTNVLYRGGPEALDMVQKEARRALDRIDRIQNRAEAADQELFRLNRLFREKGISPGGSADLLAVGMFLMGIEAVCGETAGDGAKPEHS